MARLQGWLVDPSRHPTIGQWTPARQMRQAANLAFALFLFLGTLSVSRARGWGLAAWIGASAAAAGVLGMAIAAA